MTLARGLRGDGCDRDLARTFPRPATVLETDSHAQKLGEDRPAHGQSASGTLRNATESECGGKAFLGTWKEKGMGFNRYAGALLASAAGLGMSLGVTTSFAADMPVKAPPKAAPVESDVH